MSMDKSTPKDRSCLAQAFLDFKLKRRKWSVETESDQPTPNDDVLTRANVSSSAPFIDKNSKQTTETQGLFDNLIIVCVVGCVD